MATIQHVKLLIIYKSSSIRWDSDSRRLKILLRQRNI
jgi:hypothetical protein